MTPDQAALEVARDVIMQYSQLLEPNMSRILVKIRSTGECSPVFLSPTFFVQIDCV